MTEENKKKSARRVREILEAYVESRLCDHTVIQDGTYTCCVTEVFIPPDVVIVGKGFSKRQDTDEPDPEFGAALARRRAFSNCATILRELLPEVAAEIVGQEC